MLALVTLMEECLALRHLVIVMREGQVDAARVDVHLLPELLGCHDGALNMPPVSAISPWAWPVGLARL